MSKKKVKSLNKIRDANLRDPETYDEYNADSNYDREKSDANYDEINSKDRDTQNQSLTQLIDNKLHEESILVHIKNEGKEGVEFLNPNHVENINPDEDGKFGNIANSNDEKSFQLTPAGKLVKKRGVGLLDLGVLNFTNQVEEIVEEEKIPS